MRKIFSENRAVCDILWTDRPHMAIWCCAENTCFACGPTVARPETRTFSISYSLLHIWLIPSDLLNCFVATVTKMRKFKPLICHYGLLSQTVRLKKTTNKRTFFCFNAACGTLQEDRHMFYLCNNSDVVQHSIFQNTWQFHLTLQYAECVVAFPLQQWLHERATILRYTYNVCLVAFVLVC